jgi:hypothetical protein
MPKQTSFVMRVEWLQGLWERLPAPRRQEVIALLAQLIARAAPRTKNAKGVPG